jgi:hypothetical protein
LFYCYRAYELFDIGVSRHSLVGEDMPRKWSDELIRAEIVRVQHAFVLRTAEYSTLGEHAT